MPRPRGLPKTGGRRKGSRNKRTVARELALQHARLGLELPHDTLARLARHYAAIAEDAYTSGKENLANQLFTMAADFAAKAAPFFAPRLSSVKVGANLDRGPPIIELVQYSDQDAVKTIPLPDLLEHKKQDIVDLDFDDPEPAIAKHRNGGG